MSDVVKVLDQALKVLKAAKAVAQALDALREK